MPFVSLTLAIFLSAELGFLGVVVPTLMQTPRLKGPAVFTGRFFKVLKTLIIAGAFDFFFFDFLDRFTN